MRYQEITPQQALHMLAEQSPMLLDARDSHSYRDDHIEGAMFVHDGLLEQLIKRRAHTTPVIIYCYHGNTSKDLAELIAGFGYQLVYSVKGGFVEWKKLQKTTTA